MVKNAPQGKTYNGVELLADPKSCRQVSAEARKTAARFTWKRTAEEFVDFCRKLDVLKREDIAGEVKNDRTPPL